jgi:hypothetical protein
MGGFFNLLPPDEQRNVQEEIERLRDREKYKEFRAFCDAGQPCLNSEVKPDGKICSNER